MPEARQLSCDGTSSSGRPVPRLDASDERVCRGNESQAGSSGQLLEVSAEMHHRDVVAEVDWAVNSVSGGGE